MRAAQNAAYDADNDGYLKGRTEMQYLLMLHAEEAGWERLTKEQQQQGAAAYMAYGEALKQAGVLSGSNRLRPSSEATTGRVANGKPQGGDGTYVDTRVLLGGYNLCVGTDIGTGI